MITFEQFLENYNESKPRRRLSITALVAIHQELIHISRHPSATDTAESLLCPVRVQQEWDEITYEELVDALRDDVQYFMEAGYPRSEAERMAISDETMNNPFTFELNNGNYAVRSNM